MTRYSFSFAANLTDLVVGQRCTGSRLEKTSFSVISQLAGGNGPNCTQYRSSSIRSSAISAPSCLDSFRSSCNLDSCFRPTIRNLSIQVMILSALLPGSTPSAFKTTLSQMGMSFGRFRCSALVSLATPMPGCPINCQVPHE